MDGLFPKLPKDLAALDDKALADLLADHEQAAGLIDAEDAEFLGDRSADTIIEELEAGKDAILALRAESQKRVEDAERFAERKAEIAAELKGESVEEEGAEKGTEEETPEEETSADPPAEEPEAEVEDEPVLVTDREPVLVAAAEEPTTPPVEPARPMRRSVPAPAAERVVVTEDSNELALVASGMVPATLPGTKFKTRAELADAYHRMARAVSPVSHGQGGREEKFLVASLDYSSRYSEERTLTADGAANTEKIAAVGSPLLGKPGMDALLASGGFCAPFTPIYTMPQLASQDRPVRDALPNFRATRGGINVPTPTTIGDADGAITVITAAEDALGGTFATKACLDMECPTYTETAVTIISHCREYGNLNAFAWPEKIAHENEITMADHARISESYLLGRLKTLSVNVTNGADTLGALIYLVDGILKAKYGIRSRLRLPNEARFQAFLPRVLGDMLTLDTVSTQFDRYRSLGAIEEYLASVGVDVTWYMDTPLQVGDATAAPGTSQNADASQTAAALDGFPANVQWAVFPAGTFLHLDMAELNLGIVRDSTLNSTNDFQNFGETFENVARIGPAQAAYWVTTNLCPTGQFPPAGTARTCE